MMGCRFGAFPRADKSAVGAVNWPLRLFANNNFIHPQEELLHHTAHATHAAHTTRHRPGALLLWRIGNQRISRQEHTRNAGSILQRRTCHLHGVNDTSLEHIHILAGQHIEAVTMRA